MDAMDLFDAGTAEKLNLPAADIDRKPVLEAAPRLRSMLGGGGARKTVLSFPAGALPADAEALRLDSPDTLEAGIREYAASKGRNPEVVVCGNAAMAAGVDAVDAANAFAAAAGLAERKTETVSGRLAGKIALVTGGARGFGLGIAEELAANGAQVLLADLDADGAENAARELSEKLGRKTAFALKVDISDENSVENMFEEVVLKLGGVDVLVANAGVLKAGPVTTFEKRDWDFVTNINYTGYFLCVKHAATLMAAQNAAGGPWTDIVQVNSKSGLAGSKRNAAYAGSKFGTIGLTQSFALELIDSKIKVNSVCPGNFFDGPLWSDPGNGLFVQYLRSGKVPGAKDVEDVRRHYESMIPMGRGCFPKDVAKAIMYCVEQDYETGQAIPVTGGQVMLN